MGRLYRIRRTVMQMLRDRGYLVVEHELTSSRRDFLRKFGESFHREDLQISKYKKNDPSDQVSHPLRRLPRDPILSFPFLSSPPQTPSASIPKSSNLESSSSPIAQAPAASV
ncbi:unnamed protein product [Urochloa humidicola]